MKKFVYMIVTLLFGFGFAIFISESILRIFPNLITEEVLLDFNKNLRTKVARVLNLPIKQERRCISSIERYDKGPELCLIAPDSVYFLRADSIDKQYGATELLPHDGNGFCNIQEKIWRDHIDLITVGDSFTWCTSVAPTDTFTALTEDILGISTYNLGIPGIGPYEYLEVLKRFGLQRSPKIVIMNIYEGNDLRDGVRYNSHLNELKYRKNSNTPSSLSDIAIDDLLMRHSYSLNFLNSSIQALGRRLKGHEINFSYQVKVQNSYIAMNVANKDTDEVIYAQKLRKTEVSMKIWDPALREFSELAKKHQFLPIVTYIPSAYTAYWDSVRFEDRDIAEDVRFLSESQRHYLKQVLKEYDMMFLDTTEFLQKAVGSSKLAYFPANVHLTKEGHRLISSYLTPKIEEIMPSNERVLVTWQ